MSGVGSLNLLPIMMPDKCCFKFELKLNTEKAVDALCVINKNMI